MQVRVESYSGYKADEYPLRFLLGEHRYSVVEIIDRWYGPGCRYFRVRADDGNLYLLRFDEVTQEWSLAGYREQEG